MKFKQHVGPHHYSIIEAANYLQLHSQTVYELARSRQINHRRKGQRKGRIFFLLEDLDTYLEQNFKGRAKP